MFAQADGVYCEEAAVRLLIGHRQWLCSKDFLAECVRIDITEAGRFACVDWAAALSALNVGRLVCSGRERRVLLLAASLAEGVPVDLRDTVTGLDDATATLVAGVVLHAAGHRRCVIALDGGTAWWAR